MRVPSARIRIDLHDESDTPESKQTYDDARSWRYLCGSEAAEALAAIIGRNGRFQCFEDEENDQPEL